MAPHNKERQETLQRKREEARAEDAQKKTQTIDDKAGFRKNSRRRKVEDDEEDVLAAAETRQMPVKTSRKRKAVGGEEETRKKAKTSKAASISQKWTDERRSLAPARKRQMPAKASEESKAINEEEELRKKKAAMRDQRWASRAAMMSQRETQSDTRTQRQKFIPVIATTEQESSAQRPQQVTTHQKQQDDNARFATSQSAGRGLNDIASGVASVNTPEENGPSQFQEMERRTGAVEADVAEDEDPNKPQEIGHRAMAPRQLGPNEGEELAQQSKSADPVNFNSTSSGLNHIATSAIGAGELGPNKARDSDAQVEEVGVMTARANALNKNREIGPHDRRAAPSALEEARPNELRDTITLDAAEAIIAEPGNNRAIAFLEILASNAATHRLLKSVTTEARRCDQFMQDLNHHPNGLKELEKEMMHREKHGIPIDEDTVRCHAEMAERYRLADARFEQMAATRKVQYSRQAEKNNRIYEFTDVSANMSELEFLPPVLWETLQQCERANSEIEAQKARLRDNDQRQRVCSESIEDFARNGVRSALPLSRSRAGDQALSTTAHDASAVKNHSEALIALSSQQLAIENAILTAKDRKVNAEVALNDIAAEALIAAKLLNGDLCGVIQRREYERERTTSSPRQPDIHERQSHDKQQEGAGRSRELGLEPKDTIPHWKQGTRMHRKLADDVARAGAILYECELDLENARSEPISGVNSADEGAQRVARLTRRTGEVKNAEARYVSMLRETDNFVDDRWDREATDEERWDRAQRILPAEKRLRLEKWADSIPDKEAPHVPHAPPGSVDSSFYVASLEFAGESQHKADDWRKAGIDEQIRLRESLRESDRFEAAENDFHPNNRDYNEALLDGSFFRSYPDKPEATCFTELRLSDQENPRYDGPAQGGQDEGGEQSEHRDQPSYESTGLDKRASDLPQASDDAQTQLTTDVDDAREKQRALKGDFGDAKGRPTHGVHAQNENPATVKRTRKRARDDSLERQISPMPVPKRVRLMKPNEEIADDYEPGIGALPSSARKANDQLTSSIDKQNERREVSRGDGKSMGPKKDSHHDRNAEYIRASLNRSPPETFDANPDQMEIDDGDGFESQSGIQKTPNNIAAASANDWIGDEWDPDIDGIE